MKFKIRKILIWFFVILSGIFLGYLWIGFFSPDPYYLWRASLKVKVLFIYLPRIFFPLSFGLILSLLIIKNKKLLQNLLILIITMIVLFFIMYPFLDIMNYRKLKKSNIGKIERFHPYLQYKPPIPEEIGKGFGKDAVTVFCLGESTTQFKDKNGIGWPERLEKELRKIYDTDSIFVYNLGRATYTTLNSLINYETNLRKYKPDVIIMMHNINDFVRNADFCYLSTGTFREDYGHFYYSPTYLFEQYGIFGYYWENIKHFWYYKPRVYFDQDTFPGLKPFTSNIKTLIELARPDSTKVVLLSQPNILTENMDEQTKKACEMVNREVVGKEKQWSFKTAYIGMKKYNERIKEIAEEENVYFIDLEKFIPKSLTYFYDDVHYNDTAFNIISKSLSQEIVRLNIISNKEK